MVKFVIISAMLLATVYGRPQQPPAAQAGQQQPPVTIVSQSEQYNPDGSYNYAYEASNGIKVQNDGQVKQVQVPRSADDGLGPNDPPQSGTVVVQRGSYSYTAPDGQVISISYVADENGFQAQGDAIPTPPPSVGGNAPPAAGQQQGGFQQQQQYSQQQYNQQQFAPAAAAAASSSAAAASAGAPAPAPAASG